MNEPNQIAEALRKQVSALSDESLLKSLRRATRRRTLSGAAFTTFTLAAIWLPWHWQFALTATVAAAMLWATQAGLAAIVEEARSRIKSPHRVSRDAWLDRITGEPRCELHDPEVSR